MGIDFSGVVEAVGKNITQFKPGDEVFGGRKGAFAEYVCMSSETNLMHKPANISFEQAAAVQIAGLTALQGLRDEGKLQAGQKVLINGASGGVGTFAVQIAKTLGADMTGVCSARNVELVRSIGADHVIDYTKEDYTRHRALRPDPRHGRKSRPPRQPPRAPARRPLHPDRRPKGKWLAPMDTVIRAFLLKPFVKQEMQFMISKINRADLLHLRELMETGKLTPVIDKVYHGLTSSPPRLDISKKAAPGEKWLSAWSNLASNWNVRRRIAHCLTRESCGGSRWSRAWGAAARGGVTNVLNKSVIR